ncbi:MAG: hypothetical protein ACYS47_21255 [Planctomycetota bacterium]
MKNRFLMALVSLACVAGCALPMSESMAEQMGIPTGKPAPEGYVGKALPVEEGEEGEAGVEGEVPSGVAYPRKYMETGGGVALSLRSTKFGRREDYVWSNFSVSLHVDVAPKSKSASRGFYADLSFDVGYPDSTLKNNELDELTVAPRENDASLVIPYLGMDVSLVGSEIEVKPVGFFEIEVRIGFSVIGENYEDVWFEGETEPHEMSLLIMQPGIALIARRMAGKPTPLEFFEPFAGLAFDVAWANFSADPLVKDVDFLDYWLALVLGVRVRAGKHAFGEVALDLGTFAQTITVSLGAVF